MKHTHSWTKVFSNGAYLGMVPNQSNVIDSVRRTAIGYHVSVSMEPVHTEVKKGYTWQRVSALPTPAIAIQVKRKPVAYVATLGNAKRIMRDLRAALMPHGVTPSATVAFTAPIHLSPATAPVADVLSPSAAVQHILHPHSTQLAGRSGGMEAIVGMGAVNTTGSGRRVLNVHSSLALTASSAKTTETKPAMDPVNTQAAAGPANDVPLISLRVTEHVSRTTSITPQTKIVKDPSRSVGDDKVLQPGKRGRAREQVSLVFLNGTLQSTVVDSRRIISPPVTEVVEQGTNDGVASGSWLWPSPDTDITSGFGWRNLNGVRNFHPGVDIGCPVGTPIYASNNGVVEDAGWNDGGYGNWVLLNNGDGIETVYGHMSSVSVAPGDTVSKGHILGYSGATGFVTGPHLHYEVRDNGTAVDPTPYM